MAIETPTKRRGRPPKLVDDAPHPAVAAAAKILNADPEMHAKALPTLAEGDFVIHSYQRDGIQSFVNNQADGIDRPPQVGERWLVMAESLDKRPEAATDPDASKATEYRTHSIYLIEQLEVLRNKKALPCMAKLIRKPLQGGGRDTRGRPLAALVIDLG